MVVYGGFALWQWLQALLPSVAGVMPGRLFFPIFPLSRNQAGDV